MSDANPCPLNRHDSEHGRAQDGPRGRRTPVRRAFSSIAALVFGLPFGLTMAPAATLKDSADRAVTIPPAVKSVVPAGAPAQVLLQALVPTLLAGLVEPFKPEHAIYVDAKIVALPQIPMLTRTDAPGDVAAVATLKPGVVVDYGNVSARFIAADEKIQGELEVPTVIFGGGLGETGAVARTLGAALGSASRGDAIAATAREVLSRAKPVSDLPDAERIRVYVARGQDGLLAMRAGSSFDEPIRLAGGKNVVVGGGGTFQRMTVDAVLALRPAVAVFAEQEALSSPLRAALPKDTRVVLDAGEPYKTLTGPPSLNRLVGLAALPAILHPDKFNPDPGFVRRVQASLFPIPADLAYPSPLQARN